MTVLARLDAALERWKGWETADPFGLDVLYTAARAYRELLANGPDYEAAAKALHGLMQRGKSWTDIPPGKLDHYRKLARIAVDAAIDGRLLVDPPKEEPPYRKLDPAWDGSQPYGGV